MRSSMRCAVSLCSMAHQTHIANRATANSLRILVHAWRNVCSANDVWFCFWVGGVFSGWKTNIFSVFPCGRRPMERTWATGRRTTIWHKKPSTRCRFTYLWARDMYMERVRKGFEWWKQMELCATSSNICVCVVLSLFELKRMFLFPFIGIYIYIPHGMGHWRAMAWMGSREIWIKEDTWNFLVKRWFRSISQESCVWVYVFTECLRDAGAYFMFGQHINLLTTKSCHTLSSSLAA